MRQVEVHFNVDETLLKQFKRALRKSGFSTQSEFFRSKMRELVAESLIALIDETKENE